MSDERRTSGPVAAVLVAAGASRRMGGGRNKALLELRGEPLLVHAARALVAAADALVVVGREGELPELRAALVGSGVGPDVAVVPGGAERADSVRLGLAALPPGAAVVLVHDAARPLLLPSDARAVARAAAEHGAALLVEPMDDTVKRSEDGRFATSTLDRAHLWRAQTPQGFDAARLVELHARAAREGLAPTDDASLWERWVGPVALVVASGPNFKVTREQDLLLAEAVLAARTEDERGA